MGCSPWGCEESDTTERLHFHFSLSCIGEGNGNPLHYSCLEDPREGGAWWATVYGVAQSWTRLKRLSSSSNRGFFQPRDQTRVCCIGRFFTTSTIWETPLSAVMAHTNTTLTITAHTNAAVADAKSLQSCLTLCDPRDGSPPGSPVPGILRARTLEWVAISFSSA